MMYMSMSGGLSWVLKYSFESIEKFIYLCVESEYKRTWKENECALWCHIIALVTLMEIDGRIKVQSSN